MRTKLSLLFPFVLLAGCGASVADTDAADASDASDVSPRDAITLDAPDVSPADVPVPIDAPVERSCADRPLRLGDVANASSWVRTIWHRGQLIAMWLENGFIRTAYFDANGREVRGEHAVCSTAA